MLLDRPGRVDFDLQVWANPEDRDLQYRQDFGNGLRLSDVEGGSGQRDGDTPCLPRRGAGDQLASSIEGLCYVYGNLRAIERVAVPLAARPFACLSLGLDTESNVTLNCENVDPMLGRF